MPLCCCPGPELHPNGLLRAATVQLRRENVQRLLHILFVSGFLVEINAKLRFTSHEVKELRFLLLPRILTNVHMEVFRPKVPARHGHWRRGKCYIYGVRPYLHQG